LKGAKYCEVAVISPAAGTFTYLLPSGIADKASIGSRLFVPFGSRTLTGYIIDFPEHAPSSVSLKEIHELKDEIPAFPKSHVELFKFISKYYLVGIGEVIKTALPSGLHCASKRMFRITEKGLNACSDPSISIEDKTILTILRERELSRKSLIEQCPHTTEARIKKMINTELIETHSKLSREKGSAKTTEMYELLVDPEKALSSIGKSQIAKELIHQMQMNGGRIDGRDLRQTSSQALRIIRALEIKGLITHSNIEYYREVSCDPEIFSARQVQLTKEQNEAVVKIKEDVNDCKCRVYLIHGVTGSGKTEVYLRLAEATISAGKNCIVLVPEISLTPQLLGRFIHRLGNVVAPYHSRLSNGERADQWRRILRGDAKVVIGARSAVFAPFSSVGLIVVDEEHEASFKQEDGLCYNGRDLAIWLGKYHSAPVVLGSATPSMESYNAAKEDRYHMLCLPYRVNNLPMPYVKIVDMRKAAKHRRKGTQETLSPQIQRPKTILSTPSHRVLSDELLSAIHTILEAKEQAILFLNRRGYSSTVLCIECGHVFTCENCAISLTYHRIGSMLRCHYCNFSIASPDICPKCGGFNLLKGGLGTQRVDEELTAMFPNARIVRFDRDATSHKGATEKILADFAQHKIDILIGTQMVAKGHDFPGVTLVGVIDADVTLNLPDFRAAERTFQILSQVAGRAGRGEKPGNVLIQTYHPDHYAIVNASTHQFSSYAGMELSMREALRYPPFGKLALVKISAASVTAGEAACTALRMIAQEAAKNIEGIRLLGPSSSAINKINKRYRYQLLIKATSPSIMAQVLNNLRSLLQRGLGKNILVQLDVDPQNLM